MMMIFVAEWSQSKLSIRGQPGTPSFSGQKWEHAMCLLFAAVQRKSKHDFKGMRSTSDYYSAAKLTLNVAKAVKYCFSGGL